ncbi:WecB/TagA/CpsF family glycosyltransferase [candidate division KSB1 bacterium]|nr:WecB/TagA/CpsF family glycosyltransferase [candidate division KSB1 bacterium]
MPDNSSRSVVAGQPGGRIRILFLIPSFKTGGAEIQLLSLVRGLDKSLFYVTIAAFYRGNELDRLYENTADVNVVYLEKKGALDFIFLRRLGAIFRQGRFDIVQCYNQSARLFGMIAARRYRVPAVIMTERTARLLYSSFGSRIYLFFEKFALRSADLVIANSEAGRAFAISRGVRRERTRVIYNGIDPQRLSITRGIDSVRADMLIAKDAFVVGMVARLEALKDPFTFVRAARSIYKKYDRMRFILVGDGPLLEQVKEFAATSELGDSMIFTGHRADVADLIKCMNVAILTSQRVEGCSNFLLEAMALGVPVIATRVGGNVELIEHEKTGLLVSPSSPVDVAAAIERLCCDAKLRADLADNARQWVDSRFAQRVMVSQHENLYLELTRGSSSAERRADGNALRQDTDRPFRRMHLLDLPVDRITVDDCIGHFSKVIRRGGRCHIVVINAAKVVKARTDVELRQVIHAADLIGADGVPIVWASRLLGEPLPARVNGTDLMERIFHESVRRGWKLYLLGARQKVIENVVEQLKIKFPGIRLVGFRNGYFSSIDEELAVVEIINAARPDILLLGFGTPMKEKWVQRYRERLTVPVIHGVGGSFDIVAGLTRRAPAWMQRSGLEWFYRFLQEPRRMWKRYLVTNSVFIWLVFNAWRRRIFCQHSRASLGGEHG